MNRHRKANRCSQTHKLSLNVPIKSYREDLKYSKGKAVPVFKFHAMKTYAFLTSALERERER
jgi:hypothetical protein